MTNIFRKLFTAEELYDWLHKEFPDSFSLTIYKDKNLPKGINPDYDNRVFEWYIDKDRKQKTKYALYDRAIFEVHSGDENSYINFLLEDEKANYFAASWGYKRCDVEDDYLLKFITLLLNTIHNREICKDEKSLA